MIKRMIITVVALAVYTAATLAGLVFIPKSLKQGESENNAWVQQYSHVQYTNAEKAEVYNRIGINIEKLASAGFSVYQEAFLTPYDWPKELHAVDIDFDNIYCNVRILCHKDEIGWERERQNITYTQIETAGIRFDHAARTLRYDDAEKSLIFLFHCSADSNDLLYQQFLRIFLNREVV